MNVTSYPLLVCVISFVVLAISARLGVLVSNGGGILGDVREDFGVIQAATLTLLGLIIGFTSADTEFKFSTPNPPGIPSPNKIETRFRHAGLRIYADSVPA